MGVASPLGAFPTQGPPRGILSNQEAQSILFHTFCSPHLSMNGFKKEVTAQRTSSVSLQWQAFQVPYGLFNF